RSSARAGSRLAGTARAAHHAAVPSLRLRSPFAIAAIAVLLAAALLAARTFMREFQRVAERRAQSRGVLSSPIPMPALGGVASWLGAPAGAPAPGTPMALVIFSTTDPGAGELLAEAEAWHDAYATHGVRVIGLHRPAFAFAADTARLVRALQRLGVSFPVAHDPSFAVPLPRF